MPVRGNHQALFLLLTHPESWECELLSSAIGFTSAPWLASSAAENPDPITCLRHSEVASLMRKVGAANSNKEKLALFSSVAKDTDTNARAALRSFVASAWNTSRIGNTLRDVMKDQGCDRVSILADFPNNTQV